MEGVPREKSAAVHLLKWKKDFSTAFQYYLDRFSPYYVERWIGTLVIVTIYALRLYFVKGFYLILYWLGIYVLNLFIRFLTPKVDPGLEVFDGAMLPSKGSDEFKPFVRRLPEFKFWYSVTKALCAALVLTFFSVLDVPVYWPILLCFWLFLVVATMQTQILHMRKYKYVPFSIGKKRYTR